MLTDVFAKKQAPAIAIQAGQATPVVSLFMPFDPKMVNKREIVYKLQSLVVEAERKLIKHFSFSAAEPVLERLKAVVKNLDFSTHKRSIALYVSAKGEKVFYLDAWLEEKVIVDTSLNIRALVASKKTLQQHLVLVPGTNISRIYFSNGTHLVSMFTSTRKKSGGEYAASLENFLTETDNNLSIILNYFPLLPLFVAGDAFTVNKFKIVTANESHITQLVETGNNELTTDGAKAVLQPYILNWEYIQTKHLHRRLDNAMESGKIAAGINDVTKAASQRRAKLLVVEKDYTCPVVKGEPEEHLTAGAMPFTDAVDEVIERVLSTGGDVVFADKNILEDYRHIALVY